MNYSKALALWVKVAVGVLFPLLNELPAEEKSALNVSVREGTALNPSYPWNAIQFPSPGISR
jgi:hypothetical protein